MYGAFPPTHPCLSKLTICGTRVSAPHTYTQHTRRRDHERCQLVSAQRISPERPGAPVPAYGDSPKLSVSCRDSRELIISRIGSPELIISRRV